MDRYIYVTVLDSIYNTYVTEFLKTDQNATLGLLHFIVPANSHINTLLVYYSISGLADWSAFLEWVLPTM